MKIRLGQNIVHLALAHFLVVSIVNKTGLDHVFRQHGASHKVRICFRVGRAFQFDDLVLDFERANNLVEEGGIAAAAHFRLNIIRNHFRPVFATLVVRVYIQLKHAVVSLFFKQELKYGHDASAEKLGEQIEQLVELGLCQLSLKRFDKAFVNNIEVMKVTDRFV
jgi:hypothetical protein